MIVTKANNTVVDLLAERILDHLVVSLDAAVHLFVHIEEVLPELSEELVL